mmetsp:Transcript_30378/g.75423  ORF Transcript_30378/g.75423 Transcript_30378/m.75423 type:complete len:89 (-) Transcript_30378:3393-3659(-)
MPTLSRRNTGGLRGAVYRPARTPPSGDDNRTDAGPERDDDEEQSTEAEAGRIKQRMMFPTRGLPWMVKAVRKDKKAVKKAKWGRAPFV